MDKHIISKDQVGNPHNRGNALKHIMWLYNPCWVVLSFCCNLQCKDFGNFWNEKKCLVPTLGFRYLKIFNKPAGFNKELAKNWRFQGTFCDGLFGSLRTVVYESKLAL